MKSKGFATAGFFLSGRKIEREKQRRKGLGQGSRKPYFSLRLLTILMHF
jgi:hypothetical protein